MATIEEMNKGNEGGYPQYCGACMKRIYMFTVVRETKYCADCRLKLDGYVPK